MALVEPADLGYLLQEDIGPGTGRVAIRVAEGWLRGATGLADWPAPVPADLWSWALELAALAYSNPASMSTETLGDYTAGWSGWALARRREILADARGAYAVGAAETPMSAFPAAQPWPDPVRVRTWDW